MDTVEKAVANERDSIKATTPPPYPDNYWSVNCVHNKLC